MSPAVDPLVNVENVSHEFDESPVLDNINWSIEPGQSWGILGPSGSGKTTLRRLICGYLWPNKKGTIHRTNENQSVNEWWTETGWLDEKLSSDVPDHQSLMDTVLTGVYSQSRLLERKGLEIKPEHRTEAETLVNRLNVPVDGDRKFGSLSHGEKQIVLVARALMNGPKLVVVDEPCSGMDPGAREFFLDQLNRLVENRSETSFLYITHHVEEVMPAFERILTLKDGRIQSRGPKEEIINQKTLSELYDVKFRLQKNEKRFWPIISA